MVTVEFLGSSAPPGTVSYVVIAARAEGGWTFVKHRERGGYEMPAGHPEAGEDTPAAAVRELTEETGASGFTIEPVGYYSVDGYSGKKYGRLFYAEIDSFDSITDRDEIEWVRIFKRLPKHLSLPEVMSFLFRIANDYFTENNQGPIFKKSTKNKISDSVRSVSTKRI